MKFFFIFTLILNGCGSASGVNQGTTTGTNASVAISVAAPKITQTLTCTNSGWANFGGTPSNYVIQYKQNTYSDDSIKISCQTLTGADLVSDLDCSNNIQMIYSYKYKSGTEMHTNGIYYWISSWVFTNYTVNQNTCDIMNF